MEAVLDGYVRFLLEGKPYPGIIASPGQSTRGVLYLDVDAAVWSRLDRFEDDLYERTRVRVVADDGRVLQAFTYVVPAARRHLLGSRPWDREVFRRGHLAAFIAARIGPGP